jgi:hypothetical protein
VEGKMSHLPHAKSFRDLLAYQKAKALAKEIFQLSKRFPREEMYSLTDQARHMLFAMKRRSIFQKQTLVLMTN